MNRIARRRDRRQLGCLLALIGLVAMASPVAHAQTAPVSPVRAPHLITAVAAVPALGAVVVTGRDFTPGGSVYLALYDPWGRHLAETRWLTASDTQVGPHGSQDPALGFRRDGTITERVGAVEPRFGPNGSQDPAHGDVWGTTGYDRGGSLCGTTAMVRAYDAATAVWSNLLDIDPGC